MTNKEKTLESAKMLVAERGYVVIGIKPGFNERYRIGQVINTCCAYDIGQPFVIVAETDAHDFVEQCRLVHKKFPMDLARTERFAHEGGPFYRIMSKVWKP